MRNELRGEVHGVAMQARDVYLNTPVPAPTALAGLPPVDVGFTGRSADLALLAEALRSPQPVVVSTIMGLAGIGKTTLAIKAAHDAVAAGLFSGGVLFIDMQGYSDEIKVEPRIALSVFLQAMGVPASQVPAEQAAREALYRSKLVESTKPVLVVLDNASSADQVRPLLPPGITHRVLVTSRHTVSDLHGARKITLDVLPAADSTAMLGNALRTANPDDDRLTDDVGKEIADLCGHLPLALSIVAALLSDDPNRPLADVVMSLHDAATRLGELEYDNLAVRAAFDLSYERLSEDEARLFRLLSINPGRQVNTGAAAALIDLPERETRKLLGGLRRAHMIEHGEPNGWYRFHDLLRLYAADRTRREENSEGREAATIRLLDYYVEAAELAESQRPSTETRQRALAWLSTERGNLVGAIALAYKRGQYRRVLRLAFAMGTFLFRRRGQSDDGLMAYLLALDAARQLADQVSEVKVLLGLGRIHRDLEDGASAWKRFEAAAAASRTLGDRDTEARALHNMGSIARRRRDYQLAEAMYDRALNLYVLTGDRVGVAEIHCSMGTLARRRLNDDQATEHYMTSIAICREIGHHGFEARAHKRLGVLAKVNGDLLMARGHLEAALAAYQVAGDDYRAVEVRRMLRQLR
ncbi:ATP-binding protein [Lentzea jiangxiensis]|uniref:ATP-binding protein n=1 Tax=Lentzea jiangxiensis TaxID=641025 RepID=UPI00115FF9BC|nr:tetratricopeptide repeat protein [Lentzea jiangxiensis]